jgi:hypothetical protein
MRIAVKFVVFAACLAVAAVAFLNLSGFCFSELRFRSDQEFIDAAIAREMTLSSYVKRDTRPGFIDFTSVSVVPYSTLSDFKERNPDCCKIIQFNTGDGPYTSFSQRLSGSAARAVSLTYTLHYREGAGETRDLTATSRYVVTNCGAARTTSN